MKKLCSEAATGGVLQIFLKKGAFRNFAKFTGRHLCQSLFFNKEKRLWHSSFPVNFAKFLRTPFLHNTCGGCFCLLLFVNEKIVRYITLLLCFLLFDDFLMIFGFRAWRMPVIVMTSEYFSNHVAININ